MAAQNSTGNHSSSPPDNKPDLKDQKPTLVNFENTISTLPQNSGWSGDNSPGLYQYDGYWYPTFFLKGVITFAQDDSFEFHPSDIIICSCMKTGTTWLKAIIFSIATRSRYDLVDNIGNNTTLTINNNISHDFASNDLSQTKTINPLLNTVPHDLIPLLEVDIAQYQKPRDPNLPIYATHMPYTSLPSSIKTSACKIIYIWRDPKDTFISTWHFINKYKSTLPKEHELTSLEKAFDLFSQGISSCCPYWDHVLEYWKVSQDFPDRVLFLKYEDMIEDTSFSYVKRIADFMGYSFSKEEETQGVMEKIGKFCGYESLSELEVNKSGKHRPEDVFSAENNIYFRKGKIGDWKNYLTPDMAQKLDAITREKFDNTGLI